MYFFISKSYFVMTIAGADMFIYKKYHKYLNYFFLTDVSFEGSKKEARRGKGVLIPFHVFIS